jgi:hypothetical protein
MKMSIFFSSFFSMNCSGSNCFTSPANRVENAAASKRVIGPMPLVPAHSASQFARVPMPTGETNPTPVTTTRLFTCSPSVWHPAPAGCRGYFFFAWDSM